MRLLRWFLMRSFCRLQPLCFGQGAIGGNYHDRALALHYLHAEIIGCPEAVQPLPLLLALLSAPDELTVME